MPNIRTPETKGIDHHKLPVGLNISKPVKGEFDALPMFAWVSVRDKVSTPLVMLVLLLTKDSQVQGSMSMELPVFPETEDSIVHLLSRLGWDGKVWPRDGGWPTQPLGSEEDETSITSLLKSSGLKACMTFPPTAEGSPAMWVNVQRAKGPFLMPPLPSPDEEEVNADLKSRLQELCANPKLFHPQQKPLIFT